VIPLSEDEPLNEFILRLESFADSQRLRVKKEFIDDEGNILLQPVIPYFVDSGGTPHEPVDTAGLLRNNPHAVGSAGVRYIATTFTKDAVGTTGSVVVTPSGSDILHFLYGIIVIGGVRAGGADQLYAGITGGNDSSDMVQVHLDDAGANVNEIYYLPLSTSQLGHDLPQAVTGAGGAQSMMIARGTISTEDSGTASPPLLAANYLVELQGMANTETYILALYFLSATNTAMTVTAVGGAIA